MCKLVKFAAAAFSVSLLFSGCGGGGGGNRDMTGNISDCSAVTMNDNIHINQLGYLAGDTKQVIVNVAGGKADRFAVIDRVGGKQAFSGKLKKGGADGASGDYLCYGDFTALENPGTYYVEVSGIGVSTDFSIGIGIYDELKNALLKGFYYQRCGIELEAKYAGAWARPACHASKGIIYGQENVELDANGGWHDAGDYGRYTVAAVTALADLMMAWEYFPDRFDDRLGIPESRNNIPDILDEARYELEWLLKMQDYETGGVYHKLTTKSFPSLGTMPQDDFGKLYFSPVSATATGDFAAVTAMASRIFKPFDPGFAGACLKASIKAWEWLEQNQNVPGFKNPRDITSGEYGDDNDSDERLWAAVELYRVTGDKLYGDYAKFAFMKKGVFGYGFGWQDMGGYAAVAYMNMDKSKRDPAVYEFLRKKLINAADAGLKKSKASGYRITLGRNDFHWGSNMTILNDARVLILADMHDPSKGYKNAAKYNFNYILGSNPLNQCYITGFGTKPVLDPHHRPSKADVVEQPVPGLVVGGPNSELQDEIAKINLKGKAPARCYIDNSGSYSTNETAIYWNSPAVFVSAFFSENTK